MRFPEAARVLSLKGANVILTPTNLPKAAEVYSKVLNRARACENRSFLVSANRIGVEKEVEFIGKSQIIDFSGQILAEADSESEDIIIANVNLESSYNKHVVNIPGAYEYDLFKDRRPELYSTIIT